MFDLTSSKMLLLAVIALLVVGPKDLPVLLRSIGRYVGMIKRQAAEFRAQFDEAMKESELSELKKQVEDFSREAEQAVKEAETTLNKEVAAVESEAHKTLADIDRVANAEAEARGELASPKPAETLPAPDAAAHGEAATPAPAADAQPAAKPVERAGA